MTKSIRSYPQPERRNVISRRLERKSGGLGYWGAMDARERQGEVKKVEVVAEEPSKETAEPLDNQ